MKKINTNFKNLCNKSILFSEINMNAFYTFRLNVATLLWMIKGQSYHFLEDQLVGLLLLCLLIWILICLRYNINGSHKVEMKIDVERMNQIFVMRSLTQNELDFGIPVKLGEPVFLLLMLY
jgi:hypothetical protein